MSVFWATGGAAFGQGGEEGAGRRYNFRVGKRPEMA